MSGEVVVISVRWDVLPVALELAGSLTGKIVIEDAGFRPGRPRRHKHLRRDGDPGKTSG
jgi:predicted dinucleotide-binding enzyme